MGRRCNSGLCSGAANDFQISIENYELIKKLEEQVKIEEKSQPYAENYYVVTKEIEKDKVDKDIYDSVKGYFKNPTATNLNTNNSFDNVTICGKRAEGKYTYIMDEQGNIVFGKRCNPNNSDKRSLRPTLIGGINPKVQCAGMIEFRKGKIYSVDNQSGHYRPNIKSLKKVDRKLFELYEKNPNLFHKNSKWRKKNERTNY